MKPGSPFHIPDAPEAMQPTSIRLPASLLKRLRDFAHRRGRSQSEVLVLLLSAALEQAEREHGEYTPREEQQSFPGYANPITGRRHRRPKGNQP
jgi:hypothetical protein